MAQILKIHIFFSFFCKKTFVAKIGQQYCNVYNAAKVDEIGYLVEFCRVVFGICCPIHMYSFVEYLLLILAILATCVRIIFHCTFLKSCYGLHIKTAGRL